MNGFNWTFASTGVGNISSRGYEIEVCETKDSIDYQIVSEWINKNS